MKILLPLIVSTSLLVLSGCNSDKETTKVQDTAVTAKSIETQVDGYAVYTKNCASCHIEVITAAETVKRFKELLAPPMIEVSNRLKDMILLKEEDEEVKRELVLTFIRDYIVNPDIEKSMCHMGAIDHFDIMPSMKGKLSQAEIKAVAEWVYDRYEDVEFK